MDPEAYRKDYLARLESAPGRRSRDAAPDRNMKSAADPAGADTCIHRLMARLADKRNSVEARLEAMNSINRLAFDLQSFRPYNADYVRLLKTLRTDQSSKIRRAAFQRLAL